MSGAEPRGLVFRDAVMWRDRAACLEDLRRDLANAQGNVTRETSLLSALLSAGAVETALADEGDPALAEAMALTERVATVYLDRQTQAPLGPDPRRWAEGRRWLRMSRPEGFAYYGLVPRVFSDEVVRLPELGGDVVVVGIRTIGATLSATVTAALRRAGKRAERFTLRPEGPPYARTAAIPAPLRAAVLRRAAAGASFLVVDEGPGLSGSSFLSVAEALEAADAPRHRIILAGTRKMDPEELLAPEAAARWRRFRFHACEARPPLPPSATANLSGGAWRSLFWRDRAHWPAVWPAMERIKARSGDGHWIFKFEGLGSYGAGCHERAEALGRAGLGPLPAGAPDENGFVAYPFLPGSPLSAGERTPEVIEALARYCAARAVLFPVSDVREDLTLMTRVNLATLGWTLGADFSLPCVRPVVADGRMVPHEWIGAPWGHVVKVDGVAHGDDHFYPGPTDIAWDLAGASVEFALGPRELGHLVARYRALAGEDPSMRLGSYEVAYAAFRACHYQMAAAGAPPEEAARLLVARGYYRRALRALLGRAEGFTPARPLPAP